MSSPFVGLLLFAGLLSVEIQSWIWPLYSTPLLTVVLAVLVATVVGCPHSAGFPSVANPEMLMLNPFPLPIVRLESISSKTLNFEPVAAAVVVLLLSAESPSHP